MIYNIYWVDDTYPFDIKISKADTNSEETTGYTNAKYIGKSAVKAEVLSKERLIKFIENNNYHNGGQIISTSYICLLKNDLDVLIDAYPEEMI